MIRRIKLNNILITSQSISFGKQYIPLVAVFATLALFINRKRTHPKALRSLGSRQDSLRSLPIDSVQGMDYTSMSGHGSPHTHQDMIHAQTKHPRRAKGASHQCHWNGPWTMGRLQVLMYPILLDGQYLAIEFQNFIGAVDNSHELAFDGHQQYPTFLFYNAQSIRSFMQYFFSKEKEVGFLEPTTFEEGILDRYPIFLGIVLNQISDDSVEFSHSFFFSFTSSSFIYWRHILLYGSHAINGRENNLLKLIEDDMKALNKLVVVACTFVSSVVDFEKKLLFHEFTEFTVNFLEFDSKNICLNFLFFLSERFIFLVDFSVWALELRMRSVRFRGTFSPWKSSVGSSFLLQCHAVSTARSQVDDIIRKEAISDKTRELVLLIRSMLRNMEDGEISVSPYDTAWVALVEDIVGGRGPQFPASLEWISNNQLTDGSWGDPNAFLVHDRLINTLACVIALTSWTMHPDKCDKGISFIRENIYKLDDEKEEHMLNGFEVAFPSLIEKAKNLWVPPLQVVFCNPSNSVHSGNSTWDCCKLLLQSLVPLMMFTNFTSSSYLFPGWAMLLPLEVDCHLRVDEDKLFNLFSIYGNIIRIKLLQNKPDHALVQMGDGFQAELAVHFLKVSRLKSVVLIWISSLICTVNQYKLKNEDGNSLFLVFVVNIYYLLTFGN
ncbi:hypothetical protein ACS0TY_017421 [Phlomoides rotata]